MAKEKVLYSIAEKPKDVYKMFYNAVTSVFPGAKLSKTMPRGYEVRVTVRGSQLCCSPKFREVTFSYNGDVGQGLINCLTHQMHVVQSIATVESLFTQLNNIKKSFSKNNRKIEIKTEIRDIVSPRLSDNNKWF